MKHVTTLALILNLGIVSAYAQQRAVKMTFEGTVATSTVSLQFPNTTNDEENFAGNGTLGRFSFRNVRATTDSPQSPPSACSGANMIYAQIVAGAGLLRFQDGSLLQVNLTQGADCIDLAAQQAHCDMMFQITGGTGRFKSASGVLMLTETVVPLLADASHNPVFFASTGKFTGMISGVAPAEDGQAEQ